MNLDQQAPTPSAWRKAAEDMHAIQQQRRPSVLGGIRAWWRHRRLTTIGEERRRLRELLGIEELELTLVEASRTADGLRADLDAVADMLNRANADGTAKLTLTAANLAELVRQFHLVSRLVDSHATLLRAWRGIPILAKASSAALKDQRKVEQDRNARLVGKTRDGDAVTDDHPEF